MTSSFYGLIAEFKNFLYDSGLADSVRVSPSVVSIGNLTVGGTGKTPVTDLLLKETFLRGLKAAVVSRNYKAKSRVAQRVIIDDIRGASYFGDEAYLLAQKNPEAVVFTGPLKWMTTMKLCKEHSPHIIFIDDGFQHRALYRDYDIVLIDATAPLEDYAVLPKGSAREPWHSLSRANLVVLTKVNWASPQKLEQLKAMIPLGVEVAEMEFHMGLSEPVDMIQRVLMISGVANANSFERGVRELGEYEVCANLSYPDHHHYTLADIQKIKATAEQESCTRIITTEKDLVKLSAYQQQLSEAGLEIVTVNLNVQWRSLPKGLNEYLDKISGI